MKELEEINGKLINKITTVINSSFENFNYKVYKIELLTDNYNYLFLHSKLNYASEEIIDFDIIVNFEDSLRLKIDIVINYIEVGINTKFIINNLEKLKFLLRDNNSIIPLLEYSIFLIRGKKLN